MVRVQDDLERWCGFGKKGRGGFGTLGNQGHGRERNHGPEEKNRGNIWKKPLKSGDRHDTGKTMSGCKGRRGYSESRVSESGKT